MRARLRSAQVRKALGHYYEKADEDGTVQIYTSSPDNTMLIWLGKQYLDQRDKAEHSGDPARPLQVFNHRSVSTTFAQRPTADRDASSTNEGDSNGQALG